MTKPDLQKQREQDAWIERVMDDFKLQIILQSPYNYIELGKNFIRFYRSEKFWELSIKEVKPRKPRVKK